MATPPDAAEPLELARWFAPSGLDAWRARLAQELAGKTPAALVARTLDGIELQPLYTEADLPAGLPDLPGARPAVRGHALPRTEPSLPRIAALASAPGTLRAELAQGADAVLLELRGCCGDDANGGVALDALATLEAQLDGVDLERVMVGLAPGAAPLPAMALLLAHAARQGSALRALSGWLGVDPLGALAAAGALPFSLPTALRHAAEALAYAEQGIGAGLRVLGVDTSVYHHAGCSEAQDLGFAMATAVEMLRSAEAHGIDPGAAARRTAFVLRLGCDFFTGIAKVRAARWLWARLCEACGLGRDEAGAMFVVARPSARVLTRRDPWGNMLRNTAATFAAMTAGVDVVVPAAFDALAEAPGELGRRVARNTPIVLAREAGLHRVVDPAGGAYFLEALTAQLAERGWAVMQALEADGGMARALLSGRVAALVAGVHEARTRQLATRKLPITGVSEFPLLDETPPPAAELRHDTLEALGHAPQHSEPTDAVRAVHTEPVELAAAAPGPQPGPRSALLKALIAAGGAGVSCERLGRALRTGELALRAATQGDAAQTGDPNRAPQAGPLGPPLAAEPATMTPLPSHRFAAPFERLRDASDAVLHDEKHGGMRPRVFVATLGETAEHQARASWVQNLFAAGGFEVATGAGSTDPAALARAFVEAHTPLACICGADARYAELAAPTASALRWAGASCIVLAGRPGDAEDALRDAGVTDFAFAGADVLALLGSLWSHLEHTP